MMNKCKFCNKLTKNNKFCSRRCIGLAKRGTGKSHVRIAVKGKRVYLHRHLLICHDYPLKDTDIVHHKDENKFNNTISNLEVLSDRREHLKKHNYYKKELRVPTKEEIEKYEEETKDFGW